MQLKLLQKTFLKLIPCRYDRIYFIIYFRKIMTQTDKRKFTIIFVRGKKILKKNIIWKILSEESGILKIQEENGNIHRIKNYENSIEESLTFKPKTLQ